MLLKKKKQCPVFKTFVKVFVKEAKLHFVFLMLLLLLFVFCSSHSALICSTMPFITLP